MKKVFIDGEAGTTGLRIRARLAARTDIALVTLPETLRKDAAARKAALNDADIAFLCLPDAAAVEAVSMIENPDTVVLDTSTAHRTDPHFVYGFPELSAEQAVRIAASKRIAVPGCHASGFIAAVAPLVRRGLLAPDAALTCHSVTGYSGGGKKMIAAYGETDRSPLYDAPRQYGLSQTHKHLPEMAAMCGLQSPPIFCPIVADFYSGMVVTVPLFVHQLIDGATAADVKAVLKDAYGGSIVRYTEAADADGFLSAAALAGKDAMEIAVFGGEARILLTARYDNLGKGASGAAVECMNLVLGVDPATGLNL